MLVNNILGIADSVFVIENADITGDGQVTVTDVTALVNLILHGSNDIFNVVVNTGDTPITYAGSGNGVARSKKY